MHDKPVPYEKGSLVVLPLSGEFDLATSDAFESSLNGADDGTRTIVVDFSEVTYLDSSTLNVLVRKHKSVGGRLRIVVPKDCPARRIFDLSGLSRQLKVVESLAELEG
jgi:anti-anti-sigma factor